MSHSHYFGVAQMAKLRNVPIERWPRDFVIAALGEEDMEESLQLTDPRLADCYRGPNGFYWSHWDDVSSRVRSEPECSEQEKVHALIWAMRKRLKSVDQEDVEMTIRADQYELILRALEALS